MLQSPGVVVLSSFFFDIALSEVCSRETSFIFIRFYVRFLSLFREYRDFPVFGEEERII
jgi:hypothetical protein